VPAGSVTRQVTDLVRRLSGPEQRRDNADPADHRPDSGPAGRAARIRQIGQLIAKVVDALAANGEDGAAEAEGQVRAEVLALTARFPIYT